MCTIVFILLFGMSNCCWSRCVFTSLGLRSKDCSRAWELSCRALISSADHLQPNKLLQHQGLARKFSVFFNCYPNHQSQPPNWSNPYLIHPIHILIHPINIPIHKINILIHPIPTLIHPIPILIHPIPTLIHPIPILIRPIPILIHPIPTLIHPLHILTHPIHILIHPIHILIHPIPILIQSTFTFFHMSHFYWIKKKQHQNKTQENRAM